MILRYAFSAIIIMVLSGCAATTIKQKDIKPLTNSDQAFTLSPDEQALLTKSDKLHAEFLKKGIIVKDPLVNDYIRKVTNKISPHFNAHIDISTFVIRDASLNAFAMPNGNIYFNAGLLTQLRSEEELAFVVAHEVAHVIERHGLIKHVDRKNAIVSSHVADLFLMGTGLVYFATVSDLASFSRKMETHADKEAIDYLLAAGYDGEASISAIKRLHENDYQIEKNSIWRTHPDIGERIAFANDQLTKHEVGSSSLAVDHSTEEYEIVRRKLTDLVIKIRLRNKQYELAESFILKELEQLQSSATLHYLLAETNRLKFTEIKAYAREHAWLYDKTFNDKLVEELSADRNKYLEKAEDNYLKAIAISPEMYQVYKGLGLLAYQNNRLEKAKENLMKYLESSEQNDRYIQSIMTNL